MFRSLKKSKVYTFCKIPSLSNMMHNCWPSTVSWCLNTKLTPKRKGKVQRLLLSRDDQKVAYQPIFVYQLKIMDFWFRSEFPQNWRYFDSTVAVRTLARVGGWWPRWVFFTLYLLHKNGYRVYTFWKYLHISGQCPFLMWCMIPDRLQTVNVCHLTLVSLDLKQFFL